jgi:hypothetical protein
MTFPNAGSNVVSFFTANLYILYTCFKCINGREIFFQILALRYMTKTLNQIIFFSSTKIRIVFSATLGIRMFF